MVWYNYLPYSRIKHSSTGHCKENYRLSDGGLLEWIMGSDFEIRPFIEQQILF
jgi:hypothetical protein